MTGPTIALSGVTHRYGPTLGLDVGELVIDPGVTAILGPNGSGKSTLLRLVATVAEIQTGSTRIGGLDPSVPTERTSIRRRLGYQPQAGGLPARMRVDAFCDYVGALKEIEDPRLRRRWTHWVLARTALSDVSHARIRSLSGGTRRRLALAQALIGRPGLLVLDEPLASLDSDQRSNVASILVERATDATLVLATHHPDEVAGVCDRVVVLHRGRIAFAGGPERLAEQARGQVWETDRAHSGARCRSIGAARYRCVGPVPPGEGTPVEPSVQEGYVAVVARADAPTA